MGWERGRTWIGGWSRMGWERGRTWIGGWSREGTN